ncbi:uncharacterized protein LOC115961527 [Quercus lobata]|uniref:uncharacterized protein LOC115961527 n=1 Tax=Quercus lobata TaxID=97700 RepID=UPI001245B774|nr:uncharacterized protein LOC115961527 [Quercus lobata]
MVHRLNVSPSFPSIRQKKRVFTLERDQAIAEEVRKLQEVRFIREVYYPNWLANVVMVKKASEKWRMCVDFTDLNKACPRDSYPLPRVDVLVDSTARHQLLSFMDAFLGYNQIRMHNADQEKTSFVTSQGLFRYKGGRSPGGPQGNIRHPSFLQHEAQSGNMRLRSNGRKIPRIYGVSKGDRGQPGQDPGYYGDGTAKKCEGRTKPQRKNSNIEYAFEELKTYLSSLPLLSPSQPREELFLYLVVSPVAVSTALVREEERVQKPVYYASRALRGAEERYPPMEKFASALVTTARKLKPYFQAHMVNVLTDKPLQRATSNLEATGRLALWAIELSEFDIQHRPRTAIKGQVIMDFIAEFTHGEDKEAEESPRCSIYTDGSSNKQAGGAGIILLLPEGDTVEYMVRLNFPTTNNEVEYEALVVGLDLAKAAGATSVVVYYDSQVVANQVNGDYECKGERMKRYLDQLSPLIDSSDIQEIGSESNWTTSLVSYLKNRVLSYGKEAARKLKVQASRFVLIKDVLYKRGFSRPYLRCLGTEEADYVTREVHEGICGNHSGSRSLVHKLV